MTSWLVPPILVPIFLLIVAAIYVLGQASP
jgi:hypothetical protein